MGNPSGIGQALAIVLGILILASLAIAGIAWWLSGSWITGAGVAVVLIAASFALIRYG